MVCLQRVDEVEADCPVDGMAVHPVNMFDELSASGVVSMFCSPSEPGDLNACAYPM